MSGGMVATWCWKSAAPIKNEAIPTPHRLHMASWREDLMVHNTHTRNTAARLRQTTGGQNHNLVNALAAKMPTTSGSVMMVKGGVGR